MPTESCRKAFYDLDFVKSEEYIEMLTETQAYVHVFLMICKMWSMAITDISFLVVINLLLQQKVMCHCEYRFAIICRQK